MKGTNKIAKLEHDKDGSVLDVKEIFLTIQGEGPYSGMPAVFTRFSGCGLSCYWCDSDFENGTSMSIGDILSEIGKSIGHWSGPRLVVLTGGEPLRQNILPLCELLLSANFLIQIETAGYCWPSGFGSRFDTHLRTKAIHLVCSPKTPKVHPKVEKYCRDWKYIVARDTEFAVPAVEGSSVYQADRQSNNIWVQPRDDGDETYNRLNVEKAIALCTSFGYRLSLQTHKILGLP